MPCVMYGRLIALIDPVKRLWSWEQRRSGGRLFIPYSRGCGTTEAAARVVDVHLPLAARLARKWVAHSLCSRAGGPWPLGVSALFVSVFWSFCPKVVADCQTLSFLVSFYKIRLDKNHLKLT